MSEQWTPTLDPWYAPSRPATIAPHWHEAATLDEWAACQRIAKGNRQPNVIHFLRPGVSEGWCLIDLGRQVAAYRDRATFEERMGLLGWRVPGEEEATDDG